MDFNRFRVAMFNRLHLGPYEVPHQTTRPASEWLIVERSGEEGSVLQIAEGVSEQKDDQAEAPADLTPGNTLVALLADTPDGDQKRARFIIVRHAPPDLKVMGTFFPGDGFVEIQQGETSLSLDAVGRHHHTIGDINGVTVIGDIPNPAPGATGGANWHFDAEERPWPPRN